MEIKKLKKGKRDFPKVIFREEAYFDLKKMMSSNLAKNTEFMCFGMVEKVTERKEYILSHFYLIPNKNNSGAYCEADEDRLNDFYSKIPLSERRKIRCHCHSHVNMGTSPSGTDNEQGEDFAESVSDYFIQLIINHKDLNTANVLSTQEGLGYYKVPMYIQIGDYLVKLKDAEKDDFEFFSYSEEKGISEINLLDGNYEVINGWLVVDENLYFNIKTKHFCLVGEHFEIENKVELKPDAITEEMKKEIEKEFSENVKKKEYYSSYAPYQYKESHTYYGSCNPNPTYGGYVKVDQVSNNTKIENDEYFNGMITKDTIKGDTRETIDDFVEDFSSLLTKEQAINEYNRLRKLHPDCSIDDLSNFLWEEILDKGGRDELK